MSVATPAMWRLVGLPIEPHSESLLRRFAVLFGLMVGGAVIATGLIGVYSAYEDNRNAMTQLQSQQADAAASRINQFFTDTMRILEAAIPPSTAPLDLMERRDDYLRVLRLAPSIVDLTYVDFSGKAQVRVSRLGVTQLGENVDLSTSPSFTSSRNGYPYYGPAYFSNGSEPHMTVAYPAPAPGGGVTIANVNLTSIWQLISSVRVGRAGQAYVVDRDGKLIAHPDISLVLRNTDLSSLAPVQDALGGHAVQAAMSINVEGQRVITTSQIIPAVGWWVVVEQPAEEALSGLFASLARTTLLVLCSLAGGLLLSILVARKVVRPIQAMEAASARTEQALGIARRIQMALLPRRLPLLPGWRVKAHYQPAHQVGGDFYDCMTLSDGRIGLFIGDVSGEGIPAALCMAETRTILRAVASTSPGEVLARTNELLYADTPDGMFATCLYAVLDPRSGKVRYSNAGHVAPYQWHAADGRVTELRARGMPLGLMPGMQYEECDAQLGLGDLVVAYSDGLIEAHNSRHEMFGTRRVSELIARYAGDGLKLGARMLRELGAFTGPHWEQEDDLTLVVLERQEGDGAQLLTQFDIPSQAGNERLAMRRVAEAVQPTGLAWARVERLKSAVAETVMNAIEHGNHFRAEVPVSIRVTLHDSYVSVEVSDRGSGAPLDMEEPDLIAKLSGVQSPRGWGLFLAHNLVDELNARVEHDRYTVEMRMQLAQKEDR